MAIRGKELLLNLWSNPPSVDKSVGQKEPPPGSQAVKLHVGSNMVNTTSFQKVRYGKQQQ